MENFLLTDYKVRNVGYGSELGFFCNPVVKVRSMTSLRGKRGVVTYWRLYLYENFRNAPLPPFSLFRISHLIQLNPFAADTMRYDSNFSFLIKQARKRRLNADCSKWCISVLCAFIFLVLPFCLAFVLYYEVWDQSLCTVTDYTPCLPEFCVHGKCKQRDGLAFCDCAWGYTGRKCDVNETTPCNKSSYFVCYMSR